MTILDYCNDFRCGKIRVDTNYQRSDQVWPDAAKKYLIESIILGYPVPKFFLHQKIDVKSKSSVKYVVDGQQRSRAIVDFMENLFSTAIRENRPDISNRKFDTLPEEFQNAFLSYSLPIDLFVTANSEEIIETFRRINSYTVPLNNEEKRHAYHQGKMKWFIHELAISYSEQLKRIGVFTDKNLTRMLDYRFYSEIVMFFIVDDVVTPKATKIDKIYSAYDKDFPAQGELSQRFNRAFSVIGEWHWIPAPILHIGALMRRKRHFMNLDYVTAFQ